MQYLAMLYGEEAQMAVPGTPEADVQHAGYMKFGQKHGASIRGGEALLGSSQAVTVRTAATGEPIVSQGPFAESAEVIGGFYVLEAPTLDVAIDMARDIPIALYGAVELRPLVMWMANDEGMVPSKGKRYLGLLVGKPTDADVPGTAEWDAMAAEHGEFIAAAGDAVVAGGALHPTTAATTVRGARGDDVLVTDGPFADTAEAVSGLYVLRGDSPGEAQSLAARIPVAAGGAVELWRVRDLG